MAYSTKEKKAAYDRVRNVERRAPAGKYIAAKRPDVVVCIGDFADLPSLSTWDKPGSLNTEGRRYKADLDAVYRAMDTLMTPIVKARGYQPLLIETDGNHEDRITRAVSADPRLAGTISTADLRYEEYGWCGYPFPSPALTGGG